MKIFFPIGFYFPAQSGPGNSVYWLNKALFSRKVTTIAVAMDWNIPKEIKRDTWLEKNYGRVQYVQTSNYVLGLRYVIKSIKAGRNADLIHLTSIFAPTSFLIGMWMMLFQRFKPLVWSVRGELAENALIYNTGVKKIMKSLLNYALHSNIYFHATSEQEKMYIQKHFGLKVQILLIPNLLEIPDLVNATPKKHFLYLGRLHSIKGIDRLIEALSVSKNFTSKGESLVIAGTGDPTYTKQLKQLLVINGLENHVRFIGHIEGPEKQQLIAGAKALILPSHSENFGNVVVEALAQKTPVIASKGTPWEILEQHNAGFWVENSPLGLATAIDRLLDLDETTYQNMCNNALELVSAEFEVNRNIDKWINAYQKVLNNEAH